MKPGYLVGIGKPDWAGYAVLDQLCMAGGNFVLSIFIARTGGVDSFAVFTVIYISVILLNALHYPLINEPVNLSRNFEDGVVRVSSGIQATNVLFIPLTFAVCLVNLLIVNELDYFGALCLGLACLLSALYWTQKGLLHALSLHKQAFISCFSAAIASIFSFPIFGIVLEPHISGMLSLAAGGGAGLVVASMYTPRAQENIINFIDIIKIAKPGVSSALFIWIANNIVFFFLALLNRESDAAGLRGVLTLLIPLNQAMMGFSYFLLPRLVDLNKRGDFLGSYVLTKRVMSFSIAGAIVFSFFSLIFSDMLINLTLGSDFLPYRPWLNLAACFLPVSWIVTTLVRTYFRGRGDVGVLAKVYSISVFVSLPISFIFLLTSYDFNAVLSFGLIHAIITSFFAFTFLKHKPVN